MAIVTSAAVETVRLGGFTQTHLARSRGVLPSKGATNGEDRRWDGDRGTEAETDGRIRRRDGVFSTSGFRSRERRTAWKRFSQSNAESFQGAEKQRSLSCMRERCSEMRKPDPEPVVWLQAPPFHRIPPAAARHRRSHVSTDVS